MVTTPLRSALSLFLAILALLAGSGPAWSSDASSGGRSAGSVDPEAAEYHLKAAYLYNFARFVVWPDSAFAAQDSALTIGILVPDPFGPAIDSLLADREIAGRPVRIERYPRDTAIPRCHVLFVPKGEEDRIPPTWAESGPPTLIVGESPDFASQGGMIGFFEESEKLRFQINPEATRRRGLVVNSKLLSLASVVTETHR
ncbi:MAG: YfiR family protein [Candidatus Eisenbacteria bacterium]